MHGSRGGSVHDSLPVSVQESLQDLRLRSPANEPLFPMVHSPPAHNPRGIAVPVAVPSGGRDPGERPSPPGARVDYGLPRSPCISGSYRDSDVPFLLEDAAPQRQCGGDNGSGEPSGGSRGAFLRGELPFQMDVDDEFSRTGLGRAVFSRPLAHSGESASAASELPSLIGAVGSGSHGGGSDAGEAALGSLMMNVSAAPSLQLFAASLDGRTSPLSRSVLDIELQLDQLSRNFHQAGGASVRRPALSEMGSGRPRAHTLPPGSSPPMAPIGVGALAAVPQAAAKLPQSPGSFSPVQSSSPRGSPILGLHPSLSSLRDTSLSTHCISRSPPLGRERASSLGHSPPQHSRSPPMMRPAVPAGSLSVAVRGPGYDAPAPPVTLGVSCLPPAAALGVSCSPQGITLGVSCSPPAGPPLRRTHRSVPAAARAAEQAASPPLCSPFPTSTFSTLPAASAAATMRAVAAVGSSTASLATSPAVPMPAVPMLAAASALAGGVDAAGEAWRANGADSTEDLLAKLASSLPSDSVFPFAPQEQHAEPQGSRAPPI